VADGWADLVVACAVLGSDPPAGGEPVLRELERCCGAGGSVALVSPEDPEWLVRRGYRQTSFGTLPVGPVDPDLEAFFGPLSPPRELLLKRA
jgi:hypothetical protein